MGGHGISLVCGISTGASSLNEVRIVSYLWLQNGLYAVFTIVDSISCITARHSRYIYMYPTGGGYVRFCVLELVLRHFLPSSIFAVPLFFFSFLPCDAADWAGGRVVYAFVCLSVSRRGTSTVFLAFSILNCLSCLSTRPGQVGFSRPHTSRITTVGQADKQTVYITLRIPSVSAGSRRQTDGGEGTEIATRRG